jgi:hypothetical protein
MRMISSLNTRRLFFTPFFTPFFEGLFVFLPVLDPDAHTLFDLPESTGTPERRLLLAILERALLDYVGNDAEQVQAATEWLFSVESTVNDDFTFPWICQQLDLDIIGTRGLIKAMPKRGKHRIAPWYLGKDQLPKIKIYGDRSA